jgi:ankyrin repeat protein
LHKAAFNGALEVVRYLLEWANSKINIHNHFGQTPLHLAAEGNALDVVKYFVLENNVSIEIKDKNGKTSQELAHKNDAKDVEIYLNKLQKKNRSLEIVVIDGL